MLQEELKTRDKGLITILEGEDSRVRSGGTAKLGEKN